MAQRKIVSTPIKSGSRKVSPVKSEIIPQEKPVRRNHFKKIAIILAVLVILYLAKGLFIAALVNGKPIGRLSVISQLEKQGGKNVLDNLITQTLVLSEAQKRHITISQKDTDDQMKKIQTNVESQGGTLDQALAAQGLTKADLLEQVTLNLMLQKMVGTDMGVTGKEIDDYISQNKASLPQTADTNTLRAQVKQQLEQQKQQQKIQAFIQALQSKAKITRFGS